MTLNCIFREAKGACPNYQFSSTKKNAKDFMSCIETSTGIFPTKYIFSIWPQLRYFLFDLGIAPFPIS